MATWRVDTGLLEQKYIAWPSNTNTVRHFGAQHVLYKSKNFLGYEREFFLLQIEKKRLFVPKFWFRTLVSLIFFLFVNIHIYRAIFLLAPLKKLEYKIPLYPLALRDISDQFNHLYAKYAE